MKSTTTTNQRRWLAPLVAVAAAVGVSLLFAGSEPDPHDDAAGASQAPRSGLAEVPPGAAVAASREVSARAFGDPGGITAGAARYRLSYALELTGPGTDGATRTGTFALDAVLELAPSASPGWLAGRLQGAIVTVEPELGRLLGLDAAAPARGLDSAFLWHIEDGAVHERRFVPGMPVGARNLLTALASSLQVVRADGRDDPAARAWSAVEDGPDGETLAAYARDGATITKSWTREDGRSPHDTKAAAAPIVERGHVRFATNGHGQATRIDAALQLDADLTVDPRLPARYRSAGKATLTALGDVDPGWASGLAVTAYDPSIVGVPVDDPDVGPPEVVEEPARPVAQILADALAAHTARQSQLRIAYRRELARALEQHDEGVDEVAALLRAEAPAGADVRTMVEALALAETPRAQSALSAIVGDPTVPRAHRRMAATAAGFVRNPDAGLLAMLREVSRDARDEAGNAALNALAVQAALKNDAHAPLGAALTRELVERARGVLGDGEAPVTASDFEIVTWLEALGSIGDDAVWPLAERHLDAASPRVRESAVSALRFVSLPAARMRLAEIMHTHPDSPMRRAALRAVRYQPQAAFEAPVLRALHGDDDMRVRLAAAQTLAPWGYGSPRLYDEIERAAARESDVQVRRMLLELTPSGRTSGDGAGVGADEGEGATAGEDAGVEVTP